MNEGGRRGGELGTKQTAFPGSRVGLGPLPERVGLGARPRARGSFWQGWRALAGRPQAFPPRLVVLREPTGPSPRTFPAAHCISPLLIWFPVQFARRGVEEARGWGVPSDSPYSTPRWNGPVWAARLCIAVPSGRTQPLVPFLRAQPALTAFITIIISGLAETGGGRTGGMDPSGTTQAGPLAFGTRAPENTLSQQHWSRSLQWVEECFRETGC